MVWLLWDSRDANTWAIFRHARVYKFRDIVITEISSPKESTILGETTAINVTLMNLSATKEILNLTLFANDHLIASFENTTIENYGTLTYTLSWNTTGFMRGDYAISAHAEVLPKDLNETDDTLMSSVVTLVSSGHDICVCSVALSRTFDRAGFSWLIDMKTRNLGSFAEIFNITVTVNSTKLEVFSNVSLASGDIAAFTLVWNTTSFPKGDYALKVSISTLPDEINTTDNTVSNWVFVTIPGDVDGDLNVTILDVVEITSIYASKQGDPLFNSNADINCDGKITILDIVICTTHYGQKWS
jgi:hypothetical protein